MKHPDSVLSIAVNLNNLLTSPTLTVFMTMFFCRIILRREYPKAMRTGYLSLAVALTSGLLLVGLTLRPSSAETESEWTPPVAIAQTDGKFDRAAFVSDGSGRLHLFYSHQPDQTGPTSIDYLYWDGLKWSEPVDILIASPAGVRAAIDSRQMIHLIWPGGAGALQYVRAPASNAASPHAWSTPETIASVRFGADIAVGPEDQLYVAFVNAESLDTIWLISSTDGGLTWSASSIIAEVLQPQTAASDVRLAVDDAGHLHAVWTEYQLPDGWPPLGAFYVRSTDGGTSWTEPLQVAEPSHGQIGVGTAGETDIHLVWRSTIGGDGTFHQWSRDGGVTWAPPDRFADGGGFSGLPSFAVDNIERMHYVTGFATYAMWGNGRLSPYEDLKSPAAMSQASQSFGEYAALAMTTGNRLHVIYETDFNTWWYTSKQLRIAPAPTVVPGPKVTSSAPTPQPTPTALTLPDVTAVPTQVTTYVLSGEKEQKAIPTNAVVLLAVIPAFLLVAVVVSVWLLRNKR